MQNKISRIVLFIFLICSQYISIGQKKEINKVCKEQKLYELSVIWKEISYNFDNIDNCPNLNVDSLYKEYIYLVQNTKDDLEYCKVIKQFLAHFNNGHTDVFDIPHYLDEYIARPAIKTIYKDNKIIIANIGQCYANELEVGDEIITINGYNAFDYFSKFHVPYICTSNEDDKIDKSMFPKGLSHILPKNTKINLEVKTSNNTLKKISIYANNSLSPNNNNKQNNWHIKTIADSRSNLFAVDTTNSFAYIRIVACDKNLNEFFFKNINEINNSKNLIIDLSDNTGGIFSFDIPLLHYLINKDSINIYPITTRVNRATYKAMGQTICNDAYKDHTYYTIYCDYYHSTIYEPVFMPDFKNPNDSSERYRGKIFIIINSNTISSGESLAVALSQGNNVTVLGKKTMGAIGSPLNIPLASGLVVRINTQKTYDYQNRDISSGFMPDYEYDFSEFYKTEDSNEVLSKFVKVIKELKE